MHKTVQMAAGQGVNLIKVAKVWQGRACPLVSGQCVDLAGVARTQKGTACPLLACTG